LGIFCRLVADHQARLAGLQDQFIGPRASITGGRIVQQKRADAGRPPRPACYAHCLALLPRLTSAWLIFLAFTRLSSGSSDAGFHGSPLLACPYRFARRFLSVLISSFHLGALLRYRDKTVRFHGPNRPGRAQHRYAGCRPPRAAPDGHP
jgi:hypothetical protein